MYLLKYADRQKTKRSQIQIPQKQVSEFEDLKRRRQLHDANSTAFDNMTAEPSSWKRVGKTDFDRIMWNRENLRKARYQYKETESSRRGSDRSDSPKATALEKLQEDTLKAWVDKCHSVIHNESGKERASQDLKTLVEEGTKPVRVDNVPVLKKESLVSLDIDLSEQEGESSSVESENVLRLKVKSPGVTTGEQVEERVETGREKGEKILKVQEGVNFVLEDFYIQDLKELESLAYDEELYAYDRDDGQIIGSWRVNAKVCEDNNDCVNVQFEGLIAEEGNVNWVMYANGVVDRSYSPITEFRIEQKTSRFGSNSRMMFLHKKQKKWLFEIRETADNSETSKTFSATYQHMQRVLTESAHLLLIRKVITYRCPLNFEETNEDYGCMPCEEGRCFCSSAGGCACKFNVPLKIRKKFRLKMRTLSIGGEVVCCNYREKLPLIPVPCMRENLELVRERQGIINDFGNRFYTPVPVKFHGVDLQVVRVRRRAKMPGKLVQTSNYYLTTAGQLMAVTFNDPYPYDTSYYLQIDPKAVLDPTRVIPPERIVPLRERYMCDPELRQYFEDEVQRSIRINRSFIDSNIAAINAMKAIFQDLLNDKPHRVIHYICNFLIEKYKFAQDKYTAPGRRGKNKTPKEDDPSASIII